MMMMSRPRVAVCMTTLSLNWTKQSLPDFVENTKYPCRLILVDDMTSPEALEYLKGFEPGPVAQEYILSVTQGERRGTLSHNWNVGMQEAGIDTDFGQDYLVLLNNDIAFPPIKDGKCWLERLVDLADANPDYGWLSPYWHWTGDIETDPNAKASFKNSVGDYTDKHAGNVDDGGIGCFFILNMKAVKDMKAQEERRGGEPHPGLFDQTTYPAQWEDVDYILRMRRAGYKTGIFHSIAMCHKGSGTLAGENQKLFQPEYMKGMQGFLNKFDLPRSFGEFTVSHAIYKYKVDNTWHEVRGENMNV